METSETLNALLELFRGGIPEADFFRAWPGKRGSRMLARPVVTGEVDGETVKPGSHEARYRFRIFLPEGEGGERAETLFASMCRLAGEAYPGFSAISRGSLERDRAAGILSVSCSLSILTLTGGDGSGSIGEKVVLGGREYTASAVKISISRKGEDLISIGETEPFAVLGERTEYTVELEGIETRGLENLADFRAELGEGTAFAHCKWKTVSHALRKAAFLSGEKEG